MTPTASVWFPFVVISFVVVGRAGGSLDQMDVKPIVTDRYTGAILPLGTGLLTVFLNRVVTVLLGLTSYSLPWEIIWDLARVTRMDG